MPKKEHIVKARIHHGSNSLDITIPSDLRETLKINDGDVFKVEAEKEGDKVIIKYIQIYKSK